MALLCPHTVVLRREASVSPGSQIETDSGTTLYLLNGNLLLHRIPRRFPYTLRLRGSGLRDLSEIAFPSNRTHHVLLQNIHHFLLPVSTQISE